MRQSSRWLASSPVRHAAESWVAGAAESAPVPSENGSGDPPPPPGHVDAQQREDDDDEERPDAAADRDAAAAAHAAAVLHLAGVEPCSGTELHAAGRSLVSAHVRARVHHRALTGPGLRAAVCRLP